MSLLMSHIQMSRIIPGVMSIKWKRCGNSLELFCYTIGPLKLVFEVLPTLFIVYLLRVVNYF